MDIKDTILAILAPLGIGYGIVMHVLSRKERRAKIRNDYANSIKTLAEASKVDIDAQVSLSDGAIRLVKELSIQLADHCRDAKDEQDEAKKEIEDLRAGNVQLQKMLEQAKKDHSIEVEALTKMLKDQELRLEEKEKRCAQMQQKAEQMRLESEQLKLKIQNLTPQSDDK